MTTFSKGSLLFSALFLVCCSEALIVPEEVASILSVAYANIPPIKKGTDSRVGFGFSLGNHADFQVLFELGPQRDTNPIGTPYASSSKRQTVKKPDTEKNLIKEEKRKKLSTSGSSYLNNWSEEMKSKAPITSMKPFQPLPTAPAAALTNPPIPTFSAAPILPIVNTSSLANLQSNINALRTRLVELNKTRDALAGANIPSAPLVPAQLLLGLQQLYGQQKKPNENEGSSNNNNPIGNIVDVASNIQNAVGLFQRLTQFNVNEGLNTNLGLEKTKAEMEKITEDLSDVTIEDA